MSEELRREFAVESAGDGEMRFGWRLHGPKGTVYFACRVTKDSPDPEFPSLPRWRFDPWDMGRHWATKAGDWYAPFDSCDVRGGKPCYYDGSSLYPEQNFNRILDEGEDAVWEMLEEWYADGDVE